MWTLWAQALTEHQQAKAFVNGQIDAQAHQSLKTLTNKPQSIQKEHSSQTESYTLKENVTRELVDRIETVFYFPDGHIEGQWKAPVTGKTSA